VASRLVLAVPLSCCGWAILGPKLKLLESAHPRLPATFFHLFIGALHPWIRVYDYCDAEERAETLLSVFVDSSSWLSASCS
jgi:hypothetical protein